MDKTLSYKELCKAQSVSPLPEVLSLLNQETNSILISSTNTGYTLTDNDLFCIGTLLQDDLPGLLEISISGQSLTSLGLSALAAGLKNNSVLVKLSLQNNCINDVEAIVALSVALQNNHSLELLDLSHNK